jgi:hypothetical protein
MRMRIVLVVGAFLPLAGCATGHVVPFVQVVPFIQLAIDPMVQADAPVQIVSIKPARDNVLATVTVKNNTARPVMDFDISWSVFRPANCAVSGPAPRLQHMGGGGGSAHAEARGHGTLPPGATWGARALNAHEQTQITLLSLSRESLLKWAMEANARKLRVQVGVAYMNFQPEPGVTYHVGPDWRNVTWEQAGNIFDLDDAARQACS